MKTPEQMAEEWCAEHTCHLQMTCHAEAFLAGYAAAQPKWISVKDRLPEYNQDVLFYRAEYKDLFVGYRAEQDAYVDPEENGLTDSLIFKYYNFWMPLPELPKENE